MPGMRRRQDSDRCCKQPSERGLHRDPLARDGHEGHPVDGRGSNGVPVPATHGRQFNLHIHS